MRHLYQRCKEARRRTGLTQDALALELGITKGAVSQWEIATGTSPAVENLIALAKRGGLSFEWLATGRGPMVFGEPMIAEEPVNYSPLSSDEQAWLRLYHELTPLRRRAIRDLML